MVQLSAPSPDLIPVQKGKSSEKAPGLTKNKETFKKALLKEKECREKVESDESVEKKGSPLVVQSESKSEAVLKKTALKELVQSSNAQKSKLSLAVQKNGSVGRTGDSTELKVLQKGDLLKGLVKPKGDKTSQDKSSKAAHFLKGQPETPIPRIAGLAEEDQKLHTPDNNLLTEKGERKDQLVLHTEPAPAPLPQSTPAAFTFNHADLQGKSLNLTKGKKKSDGGDVKITVEDRRTAQSRDKGLLQMKEVSTNEPSNRVTLELVPSDDGASLPVRSDQSDGTGKNFVLQTAEEQKGAALLDRQLQGKGTQELTKNIRFVLKDHNEGEIKLILKPESLGKVRINLNLHENNIVGKIIVENNSVRQAFMNNIADLTKALEDSGFSSASLDVSVGGDRNQGRQQYQDDRPVFFNDSSLTSLDDQIPVVYEQGGGLSQINMMA